MGREENAGGRAGIGEGELGEKIPWQKASPSLYHAQESLLDWVALRQIVEVSTSFDSEGAFDEDLEDDDEGDDQFSESVEQEVEQEHAYIVMEPPDV